MCDCRTLLVFLNWHPAEGERGVLRKRSEAKAAVFFVLECMNAAEAFFPFFFVINVGYCSAREWLGKM